MPHRTFSFRAEHVDRSTIVVKDDTIVPQRVQQRHVLISDIGRDKRGIARKGVAVSPAASLLDNKYVAGPERHIRKFRRRWNAEPFLERPILSIANHTESVHRSASAAKKARRRRHMSVSIGGNLGRKRELEMPRGTEFLPAKPLVRRNRRRAHSV